MYDQLPTSRQQVGISFAIAVLMAAILLGAASWCEAAETVSFNRDIRTIFNQHCVACHGGVKQAAGLSLVYPEEASWLTEAGSPEDSYLIERVESDDPDYRMPPPEHGPQLSEEELRTLKRWISEGAKWESHWSFTAPSSVEPPDIPEDNWSRSRIDPFVLQRMQSADLKPNPPAAPERWLRRVCLDLTGLPPTLKMRRQFLGSLEHDRETAYQTTVDQLLDSPAYGERWASVWLDAIRYADSKGLGQDGRRTIWKYRDWVIDALNDDMPYDQFTIKQLAGDLLDNASLNDRLATACHRLTQTNEEGGTDDEQFRVEAVIDRINTTWQAWQGLTFGCVQCHSHPYDPIEHEEYYRFMSFFNNTLDCDLSSDDPKLAVPVDPQNISRAEQLDAEIVNVRRRIWESGNALLQQPSRWRSLQNVSASTNNSTRVEVVALQEAASALGADTEDVVAEDAVAEPTKVVSGKDAGISPGSGYRTVGTVARNTTVTLTADLPAQLKRVTALRFTGYPKDLEQARLDSEWGFVLSHVQAELLLPSTTTQLDGESETAADESTIESVPLDLAYVISDDPQPIWDPQESLNPKSGRGAGPYSRVHYPRAFAFVLDEPREVPEGARLKVSIAQNVFQLGAFPLVAHRGQVHVSDSLAFTEWLASDAFQKDQSELEELLAERQSIDSVDIPVMQERPQRLARSSFVFERGNFLSKGAAVEPQTPGFLPPLPEGAAANRLAMAKWIASPDNPLTARVHVNRIWAQLFGAGLVQTQEDFGSSGDPPTHPRLLDDLATRFQTEMGWSQKRLLRELVLSSTYRQSAQVTPNQLAIDPDNRLLSRGPRKRLPAEMIRDQALAIAGLLSKKRFGPPVHPPIPDGVWMPFQGGDKWRTPDKDDPDRYRRTIYTYTKRSIPFPIMASFDAPSREFCAARRLQSNTPIQALMTLNDQTFIEASVAFAAWMEGNGESVRQEIRSGFVKATCRQPTSAELATLVELYQRELGQTDANEGEASSSAANPSTNALDGEAPQQEKPKHNKSEHDKKQHALRVVANVLLNLDEVLTK